MLEAHVDDQSHTQVAQARVIVHGGRGADEEVGGDGVEIHAGNLTITKSGFFNREAREEREENPLNLRVLGGKFSDNRSHSTPQNAVFYAKVGAIFF
jgi:hypothetical protein